MDHQKKLEDARRKEMYRDAVKKRSNEAVEEKKFKTLARLEGLEIRSPGASNNKNFFSTQSAGNKSRSP